MEELQVKIESGKIFVPLKNSWHIATPEERVRQNFICVLVNKFGYALEQMTQELQVNNSQRGQGMARADIIVWKNKEDKINGRSAFIVVECKAENIKIHERDYFQGSNYAAWAGASFFVTTNIKETKFFNVDKNALPKDLEEIVTIPLASEVENQKRIKEILSQTKAFSREEFTNVLFTCHNIIRNNDKLSPEAAFDEISKILFMKIMFERDMKGSQIFTQAEFELQESNYEKYTRPVLKKQGKDLPFMQILFEQTKSKFEEDHLFENNEVIKIKQNSFLQILKQLEKYNLSDTSDDVKGIAFEKFLGKTFRGELGQFFTPRTIVDFMTQILDPKEGETICDPTCGSGGFLIKAFEYIRNQIEQDIQNNKDRIKAELTPGNFDTLNEKDKELITEKINGYFEALSKELECNTTEFESRLKNLSFNCIYGTDANPRMARTSKMNMIMHGDGHGGVHHHDGLLDVNGIFEERFDVILTNPPFGARVDKNLKVTEEDRFLDDKLIAKYLKKYGEKYQETLKKIDDAIANKKSIIDLFDVGQISGLTEVLFMERCLRLLKKGGRMAMVLPEGVLNNSNLQKVRDYFEGRAKILLICSIPQDVFIAAGATVKPSLVFMKRFTEEEEKQYDKIKRAAYFDLKNKYRQDFEDLEMRLGKKSITKIQYNIRLKELNLIIDEEAKLIIKERFDYQIAIAKVEKAGITTTGAACENELNEVEKAFADYNHKAKLWEPYKFGVTYLLNKNGQLVRSTSGTSIIIGG